MTLGETHTMNSTWCDSTKKIENRKKNDNPKHKIIQEKEQFSKLQILFI